MEMGGLQATGPRYMSAAGYSAMMELMSVVLVGPWLGWLCRAGVFSPFWWGRGWGGRTEPLGAAVQSRGIQPVPCRASRDRERRQPWRHGNTPHAAAHRPLAAADPGCRRLTAVSPSHRRSLQAPEASSDELNQLQSSGARLACHLPCMMRRPGRTSLMFRQESVQ